MGWLRSPGVARTGPISWNSLLCSGWMGGGVEMRGDTFISCSCYNKAPKTQMAYNDKNLFPPSLDTRHPKSRYWQGPHSGRITGLSQPLDGFRYSWLTAASAQSLPPSSHHPLLHICVQLPLSSQDTNSTGLGPTSIVRLHHPVP